jgi:hypothetical protein
MDIKKICLFYKVVIGLKEIVTEAGFNVFSHVRGPGGN